MNRNTVIVMKYLSFIRDVVQLNIKTNRFHVDHLALSVSRRSGTVNNGVSRRQIRTAGQPIVFVRSQCSYFRDNEY